VEVVKQLLGDRRPWLRSIWYTCAYVSRLVF